MNGLPGESSKSREIQLYRHDPLKILPLLEGHLPYSLPVYGTIKSNPKDSFRSTASHVSSSIVQSSIVDSVAVPIDDTRLSQEIILTSAWCTFPETPPDGVWSVIIHVPGLHRQTRLYCSAEALLANSNDPQIKEEGQKSVGGSISLLKQHSPQMELVGALNLLWTEGVRRLVKTEQRPICDAWLAPENPGEIGGVDMDGLVVDGGREEDCEMIASTRDIKEDISYYITRIPYTTVVRPISHGHGAGEYIPAVAWIITHAAGDQGALYTLPSHRRRGLAKLVVKERLSEAGKSGVRGYVWVVRGNEASAALWKGMGWEKGWGVEWVYVR